MWVIARSELERYVVATRLSVLAIIEVSGLFSTTITGFKKVVLKRIASGNKISFPLIFNTTTSNFNNKLSTKRAGSFELIFNLK